MRALPGEKTVLEWLSGSSNASPMEERHYARKLREIEADHRHGATELARMALDLLSDYARNSQPESTEAALAELTEKALELEKLRPSMAPIANLVGAWREQLSEHADQPFEYAGKAWSAYAEWLMENSREAVANTASNTCQMVKDGMTIMTHSISSTLVSAFRQMTVIDDLSVIATESRPQNEGHWLCKVLSELEIPNQLVTDAQMALAMQEVDLVLIGADALMPDGSVVNKAGTHLLALAAREYSVPVYVCCETYKRLPAETTHIELEEMDPAELMAPNYPSMRVRNVYFEITPVNLLSGWVNEEGVVKFGVEATVDEDEVDVVDQEA